MLANVRENLKGTLVVVVIIIFIVPMVIGGVGSTFMGSGVSRNDAATVNGENITEAELSRMIQRQRYLYQQQGIDASSPLVQDEYLRSVALDNLTRRVAMYTAGKSAGMTLSNDAFRKIVSEIDEFKSNGVFDKVKAQRLLSQSGFYTMSGYRSEAAKDYIIEQQTKGLQLSAFATQSEYKNLLKVTHQKRSFAAVKLPREKVADEVVIDEQDLTDYYEANLSDYAVSEKLKVAYLELSVESLAKNIDVDEADIQEQYQVEIENFSNKPELRVAHILIEDSDQEKINEVQKAVDEGAVFSELAQKYSDDIATSDEGGELGLLQPEIFPKEFEDAAYALNENEVSAPVKTDSGTHFVKVLSKTAVEIPDYDSRKDDIKGAIAAARAAEVYAERLDTLGELTFTTDSLAEASDELSLPIIESDYFDQSSGEGIAEFSSVRDAAFENAVYEEGHNSNTINIGSEKAVVLRIKDKKEAYTKPFDEVKEHVEASVKEQKTTQLLSQLAAELKPKVGSPDDLSALKEEAESLGYIYEEHELVQRSSADVDPELMSIVMSADKPTSTASFVEKASRSGDFWMVAVTEIKQGEEADLADAEKTGFMAQLNRQLVGQELGTYQTGIIDKAEIKIREVN